LEDTIETQLIRYYKRLDEITLVPISTDYFKSIEYTPLNQHYKPILTLCELLLRDSALDEEIGQKTSISFLINMNKLFEEFIGNLLGKKLYEYEVDLQKIEHPEKSGEGLIIKLDILISRNGIPLFIIDTKYQETSGKPEASHLEQLSLYSNTTHIKNCALVYAGKSETRRYDLKEDIAIHILSFDLAAQNQDEFRSKCDDFIGQTRRILDSLNNKD
jgi:5-methylcytosine-specific restriction enzyme subunit McrC